MNKKKAKQNVCQKCYTMYETFKTQTIYHYFALQKVKLKFFENYLLVVTCDKVKIDQLTNTNQIDQY